MDYFTTDVLYILDRMQTIIKLEFGDLHFWLRKATFR